MPNALIAFVPVVRIICGLKKTLRSRTITSATLDAYDDHFRAIMNSWPDPYPMNSTAPLDPALFSATFLLQIARFHLYRHNSSPICRPAERQQALHRCVSVAKDTAAYLQRSMQTFPVAKRQSGAPSAEWVARMANSSPFFIITHFWRCALVSALFADYATSITCATAMASVGENSKINGPCGRYLEFFLGCLLERVQTGRGTLEALQSDEEMLCYVSADMQGTREYAWAWAGSEAMHRQSIVSTAYVDAPTHETGQVPGLSGSAQGKDAEWGGWNRVLDILNHLQQDHQRRTSQSMQQAGQLPHQQQQTQQAPPQHQQMHAQQYQQSMPVPYPHPMVPQQGQPYYPPQQQRPQTPLGPPLQHQGAGPGLGPNDMAQRTATSTPSTSRMNIKQLMH